ncbi:MAG TPA: FG-GAP repeat protein [Planctomycetota bacterium]|nr:FG-GAP repeat protein [Planctomycetota bacterium]
MRASIILALLAAPSLAQDPIYRVDGTTTEFLGMAMDVVDDLDGDGVRDLLCGAQGGTSLPGGKITIFSGATGTLVRSHVGSPSSILEPRVTGIGDLNGDGRGDYLVPRTVSGGTLTHIDAHSGADGSILFTRMGNAAEPQVLCCLDDLGDVNGDTIPDFVVGSLYNGGQVRVCSGVNGSELYALTGSPPNLLIGVSVTALGDVDGDGISDFAFGATSQPSWFSTGVFVHSGANGAPLFALHGGNTFGVSLEESYHPLAGTGDVDGDGLPDIAISEIGANGYAGQVHVYSSGTHALLRTLSAECPGVVQSFTAETFGSWIANVGDIDGDQLDDLGVGTQLRSASVFSLASGAKLYEFHEARWFSNTNGSVGGANIVGIDDADGDGRGDVVVSSWQHALGKGRITAYRDGTPLSHGTGLGFGDGSGTPCPCGNTGQSGAGCANSSGMGATLQAFGSTSVSADTLYLEGEHYPAKKLTVLIASAATQNGGLGLPAQDGLLVCASPVKRLVYTQVCSGGNATWGSGLAAFGGWLPGDTRYFQAWYRDLSGPCGSASNLSSAVSVTFTP